MNETSKQRIEFIDLAKGLCILLVVSWHVDTNDLLYCNDTIERFFKAFRMPLYFILSGVFLSIKGNYFNFFQKKINKIIIPFIHCCPEKFYHKVGCSTEPASGTQTGVVG